MFTLMQKYDELNPCMAGLSLVKECNSLLPRSGLPKKETDGINSEHRERYRR